MSTEASDAHHSNLSFDFLVYSIFYKVYVSKFFILIFGEIQAS